MAEEKTIVRSIRATPEVFQKIKRLVDKEGFENQGEAINSLVNLWEENQGRKALPEMKTTIDDITTHLDSIRNLMVVLLESSLNTSNRVKLEYDRDLSHYKSEIRQLEEQLQEQNIENSVAYDNARYMEDSLGKILQVIVDNKMLDKFKDKNIDLIGLMDKFGFEKEAIWLREKDMEVPF